MSDEKKFEDRNLAGAVFLKCTMTQARFEDIDLSDAHFDNVNLRGVHVRDAKLSGAVIEEAQMVGPVFRDCAMPQARFEDIKLADARFDNVDMRGVHIRDANLTGAVIDDSQISGMTVAGYEVAALIAARAAGASVPPVALASGLVAQAPRAFLPTRDFAASTAFYEALGFTKLLDSDVAIFSTGPGAFILQRAYDATWAQNCMMQLMVDDLDAWWAHISALDLPQRFDVAPPRAPAMQSWGLRVAYVFDPAGVLWHFAQRRTGTTWD